MTKSFVDENRRVCYADDVDGLAGLEKVCIGSLSDGASEPDLPGLLGQEFIEALRSRSERITNDVMDGLYKKGRRKKARKKLKGERKKDELNFNDFQPLRCVSGRPLPAPRRRWTRVFMVLVYCALLLLSIESNFLQSNFNRT